MGGLKLGKKAGDGPKWWCHENDSSAARRGVVCADAGAAREVGPVLEAHLYCKQSTRLGFLNNG